jgi:phage N-6-adenine-methyltransferase
MSSGFYSSAVAMSSVSDDWSTPASYFQELQKEFTFVLDPAAGANNHKAPQWFGLDHPDPARRNGLITDWTLEVQKAGGGVVFLNPPYGRTIGLWMAKAAEENSKGTSVVCLVPARTDTAWFQDHALHHELRFIRGRLKFGDKKSPAPFPSCLVVMR